jgi:hypothetical protein
MLAAAPRDDTALRVETVAVSAAALALAALAARRRRADRVVLSPRSSPRSSPPPLLVAAVIAALSLALGLFLVSSLSSPHGGWDAWITWNLRVRQVYTAEPGWRAGFAPLPGIHHPDYPLLLPGFIARLWLCAGTEWATAAPLVAMGFTFGTAAIAATALAPLRGGACGAVAALALLGTPAFIEQGAGQYADVPLAFFILASLAAAALAVERGGGGAWVVAGAMAGCAAWTKNEGIVLVPALTIVALIRARRTRGGAALRTLGWFLAGLTPVAVAVVSFKVLVTADNDIVSPARADDIVQNLADPSRYLTVLSGMLARMVRLGGVTAFSLVALVLVLRAVRREAAPRPNGAPLVGATLAALLAAYVLSYVITPHDLEWHLRTSVDRLLLHLWPGAVFTLLLALHPGPTRTRRVVSLRGEQHQLAG